ncbi:dCMP deaminase [Actinoplanes sp. TBRC 11911]|uniref:deaminase n=1 Tax=Actinoplanes sp. TBRC 11911 TaxID=2729386 RepID=UPI00145E3EBC|nr:deaminase [Actinoplanes sp. TBRC 11911]NMO56895.1 dCMP deaminase [Actinoplanes sp. TBRC 11911]
MNTKEIDRRRLKAAIELSRLSPPADSHYAVGAVITDANDNVLATGYTAEGDLHNHAEEAALAKLAGRDLDLSGATIYTSLEPCTMRKSRPDTCTELIVAAGIGRVVLALREPSVFADCHGVEDLTAAGVEVVEMPELGRLVATINGHLLAPAPTADAA